jgi:hypothetical protein
MRISFYIPVTLSDLVTSYIHKIWYFEFHYHFWTDHNKSTAGENNGYLCYN